MRIPKGSYRKVKTYASGKRVRLTITPDGRVVARERILNSRVRKTKTGRKLAKRRRRIGLR